MAAPDGDMASAKVEAKQSAGLVDGVVIGGRPGAACCPEVPGCRGPDAESCGMMMIRALIVAAMIAGGGAPVIEALLAGPAVIVGHAYGNWVSRMTAVDHTALVRGVVLAAAAAYPAALSMAVTRSADPTVLEAERRRDLERGFFAPGLDSSG